jgi:putative Ca2+/H+ antiporter (TMEM165/GDT1 family)
MTTFRAVGDDEMVYAETYGGEYWPADVWSGIVISVTLLVLLAIAVGCMFELQTPTRWEKPKRVTHN